MSCLAPSSSGSYAAKPPATYLSAVQPAAASPFAPSLAAQARAARPVAVAPGLGLGAPRCRSRRVPVQGAALRAGSPQVPTLKSVNAVPVLRPHLARACNVQLLNAQAARDLETNRVRSGAVVPGAIIAGASRSVSGTWAKGWEATPMAAVAPQVPARSIDRAPVSPTWVTVREAAPIGAVAPQSPSRAMVDTELSKHCEPLVPLRESVRIVQAEDAGSLNMPPAAVPVASVYAPVARQPAAEVTSVYAPMAPQPAAEFTALDNCSGSVRQAVTSVPYTGICYVPLQERPSPDLAALEEMVRGSYAEAEAAGAAELDREGHGYQLTLSDVQAHQTSSDGIVASNELCRQGEFRPTTAVAAVADEHAGSDQFAKLLSSLEARVDLMAHMQQTRAQIQLHARNAQMGAKIQNRVDMYPAGNVNALANETGLARSVMPAALNSMPMNQPIAPGTAADDDPPPSGSGVDEWGATVTRVPQCNDGASTPLPQLSATASAPPAAPELGAARSVQSSSVRDAAEEIDTDSAKRLADQNALLWSQFKNQRECIAKLTDQVEGMRNQVRELSSERSVDCSATSDSNMLQRWRGGGKLGMIQEGDSDFGMTEAAAVRGISPGRATMSKSLSSPVSQVREGSIDEGLKSQLDQVVGTIQTRDADLKQLQRQLISEQERQKSSKVSWAEERKLLMSELEEMRLSAGRRAMVTGSTGGSDSVLGATPVQGNVPLEDRAVDRFEDVSTLLTTPVLPAAALRQGYGAAVKAEVEAKRAAVAPCVTPPLCKSLFGANIEISTDGYVAKRTRGCRQSVVIGSAPLERQEQGWYFEVNVRETVSGWVGGLGIGVTRTPPSELRRMPDKAWRIPSTFIVGYWGCVFLDGRERRTKWKADSLAAGSRVGLLVTGDGRGDLVVFADGLPVVRAEDVLATGSPVHGEHVDTLYPVIDVFAATLEVELLPNAEVPAKPWMSNPSPPGSPASLGGRSIASSSCASHLFVAPDLRDSR